MQESSLLRNTFRLFSAKIVAFAFAFALPLLLVRRLTVSEFGEYKQVFLLVDTAVAMLPLGFALSAVYFFPRLPERKTSVVANILLFYAGLATVLCVVLVAFPTTFVAILNAPILRALAPPISLALLFAVASSFFEVIAIANGDVRVAAVVISALQCTKTGLLLTAALAFGSIRALIYAAVLYGAVQTGAVMLYITSRFPGWWRWTVDWSLLQAQFTYTLPLAASTMLWWLQMTAHNYVVSNRFGAAVYAIYAVGTFQLPFLGMLLESVGSVIIPRVSELQSRNDHREIAILLAWGIRTLATVFVPAYVLLLITGRELIAVLFTQRYLDSWPIFAVNISLIPFGIIAPVYDAIQRGSRQHLVFLLKIRALFLGPLLAGLWLGTEHFGPIGAIGAVVAVTLVERVIMAVKVVQVLGMAGRDVVLFREVGTILVATAAAGAITGLGRHFLQESGAGALAVLLASCALFALVYLGAVLLPATMRSPMPRYMARRAD